MNLMHIQESALKYSNAISTIFDLDVVIIDREYNRIAHTSRNVSDSVKITRTSVIGEVMNTGKPLIIENKMDYHICKLCDDMNGCPISGLISIPIFLENDIIGAIALLVSNNKETNIFENIGPAIDFVQSMADLISSKLKNLLSYDKLKQIRYEREMIINNIEDGLIMFNTEGKASYYNNLFLDFFNIKKDITGLPFEDIFNHNGLEEIYYQPQDGVSESFYYENKEYSFLGIAKKKTISLNGRFYGCLLTFKSLRYNYNLFNRTLDTDENINFDYIVGKSDKLIKYIDKAKELSTNNKNILIVSEKGLQINSLARAIHNFSDRSSENFKIINCKDKSAFLLEEEIFDENTNNIEGLNFGIFTLINKGTVFIRNIEKMAPYIQKKLLYTIKTKHYNSGMMGDLAIDIRFIFHSSVDLESLVLKGGFNEELYYRIHNNLINIPPLRERPEDIKENIDKAIREYKLKYLKPKLEFRPEVLEMMYKYNWPENLLEIDKSVNKIISKSNGEIVNLEDVKEYKFYNAGFPKTHNLESIERKLIKDMLKKDMSKEDIAAHVGISRSTLYRKINKYKLNDL